MIRTIVKIKYERMKTTINHNRIMAICLPALVLLLLSCGNKSKAPAADSTASAEHHEENIVELTKAQYQTVNIQTGTVTLRELSGSIKVNGMLDVPPQQTVSISMPYGGILRNTSLLEGYWVKKGQVIAQMEHPDYIQLQQDYLEAKSQLGYLSLEFERQRELSAENVTSRKTFQKTEADHRSQQVKLEALKQKLLLMNINVQELEKGTILRSIPVVTPISGYVTRVNANIGKFVSPNEAMFQIVDTEHLHAEITVFEKDIPRLKIGRKVRFILSSETKERTATIHLIGREIDSDRTIRVHCHLDREDREMMPGTYLKAWIETGAAEVPSLPEDAIVMDDGKEYIFLQEPGDDDHYHFNRVEVKTGVSEGGYTEVMLPAAVDADTARVVISGAADLLAKMKSGDEEGHGH